MAKKNTELTFIDKMKPAHIRFVQLYLGGEDGKCFNNATLAYIRAFNIDTPTKKVKGANGAETYTKEYLGAKSSASALLTTPNIVKYRDHLLLEVGFDPKNIKKRYAELGYQNKNLPIALTAVDRVAKIAGVLKEDRVPVDIPQLAELTEEIKKILTPKK